MTHQSFARQIFARFMRAFFYLLYQPMAWSYDLVAWIVSWGRWKDWVMTVLPHLEGPRVLELGHGPGHLQVALHRKGIRSFGVDASRQMGKQASRRINREQSISKLLLGYAQILPFPDSCFDQIVATFPTEYITTGETLSEAHRTLKTGGTLVVLPAAWITGKRLIDRGTAALFRVTGQTPEWMPHPGWEAQWLKPFVEAGFQSEVETITRKSWSLIIISAHKIS